jgi:hypothetical protein
MHIPLGSVWDEASRNPAPGRLGNADAALQCAFNGRAGGDFNRARRARPVATRFLFAMAVANCHIGQRAACNSFRFWGKNGIVRQSKNPGGNFIPGNSAGSISQKIR